jgi:hypothetical protein
LRTSLNIIWITLISIPQTTVSWWENKKKTIWLMIWL